MARDMFAVANSIYAYGIRYIANAMRYVPTARVGVRYAPDGAR